MKTRTDELYTAAHRQLTSYLATGITGRYQQAIDRLTATGMRLEAFQVASEANARHLLGHIGA